MHEVLNNTLSVAEHFVEVPAVRTENRIISHKPRGFVQYKSCPETNCEELTLHVQPEQSMIEVLKLHEDLFWKERVTELHTSRHGTSHLGKVDGTGKTRTSNENGTMAVRSEQLVHRREDPKERREVTMEERKIDTVETARPWRDLGDAKMDPEFLFPETSDRQCPVNKNARKRSKDEASEYMRWIHSRIPNVDKKDERLDCPSCNKKNYPRWSCHRFYKHQNENVKHSCTLRIGGRPAFLCPQALVNNDIAKPNWAQRERKMAIDDQRAPDLRRHPQGVPPPPPPPPAEQPLAQAMETSDPPAQQDAAPELTAPLCAAALAIHGPPPSSSRPTSTTRQPLACSSLPKCPRRSNMDRTETLSWSRTLYSRQLVEP